MPIIYECNGNMYHLKVVALFMGIFSRIVTGQISSLSIDHVGGNDMKLEEELYGGFSREEIRSNIASLYQAKLRAERASKEDPLASLAEEMSENGMDYTCLRKQPGTSDFIYENRTDFAKELKFAPNNYNCGKQFDIGKLLNLVRKYGKLKPYTVGSEGADIDTVINKITLEEKNEKKNNNKTCCNNVMSGSKPILGKDILYKSNISTTITPHGKGGWWLGANQKNFANENKAKLPLKNLTNISTLMPNLFMQNLNKGKKLIPTTKNYIKPNLLPMKYPANLIKSEKLHKSISSSKQNLKELKSDNMELSRLSQKNQPKISAADNMVAKVNIASISQQNQFRNQNQKNLHQQYQNGLLTKQENLAKSNDNNNNNNNNYVRQNLHNSQISGNMIPSLPEAITAKISSHL